MHVYIVILPGAKCRGSSSCVYCDGALYRDSSAFVYCDVIPWALSKVQVYIEMLAGASYRGSSTYVYWDVTWGFWCMCILKCYLGSHAGPKCVYIKLPGASCGGSNDSSIQSTARSSADWPQETVRVAGESRRTKG